MNENNSNGIGSIVNPLIAKADVERAYDGAGIWDTDNSVFLVFSKDGVKAMRSPDPRGVEWEISIKDHKHISEGIDMDKSVPTFFFPLDTTEVKVLAWCVLCNAAGQPDHAEDECPFDEASDEECEKAWDAYYASKDEEMLQMCRDSEAMMAMEALLNPAPMMATLYFIMQQYLTQCVARRAQVCLEQDGWVPDFQVEDAVECAKRSFARNAAEGKVSHLWVSTFFTDTDYPICVGLSDAVTNF